MKLRHTTKKSANRSSMYGKAPNTGAMSAKRDLKRDGLHRRLFRSFGCQKLYVQRIFYRKDMFGNPCYKLIQHAVD